MVTINKHTEIIGNVRIGNDFDLQEKVLYQLISFWEMNQSAIADSSITLIDVHAGRNGTATNSNDLRNHFVPGKFGNALWSPGTFVRSKLPGGVTKESSISFYLDLGIWNNGGTIMESNKNVNSRYRVEHTGSSNQMIFSVWDINDIKYTQTISYPYDTGTFHHLVLTFESGNFLKFYKNNVLIFSLQIGELLTFGNLYLTARKPVSVNKPILMSIDEVGMWDRVLDTQDINHLYNTGTGRVYPFLI